MRYCRPGVLGANPARRNASAIASPLVDPAGRSRFSDPVAAISRCTGESDGLQIKGIAQNSCRARFDAHSKRGTESSNPTLGSFGRSKKRQRFCHARRSDKWVLSPVLSPGRACSRHRGRHDKRHAKNATVRVTHRVSEGSYDSRCLGEPEISRAKYHRRRLSCSRTATWGWPSVRLVNPRLCLPHEYLLAFWRKAAT